MMFKPTAGYSPRTDVALVPRDDPAPGSVSRFPAERNAECANNLMSGHTCNVHRERWTAEANIT